MTRIYNIPDSIDARLRFNVTFENIFTLKIMVFPIYRQVFKIIQGKPELKENVLRVRLALNITGQIPLWK